MGRIYDALMRAEAERRGAPPSGVVAPLVEDAAPFDEPAPDELPDLGTALTGLTQARGMDDVHDRLASLEVSVHALDDRLDESLPHLTTDLERRVEEMSDSIDDHLRRHRNASSLQLARSTRRLTHAIWLLACAVGIGGIAVLLSRLL